jgi:broad specificity phosphatase PhoE
VEIVLVRHGQPEWVKDDLNVDNPPLTALGFRQAELVGRALEKQHFDEVWVSPLLRAQQTAAPLLQMLDLPLGEESTQAWLEEIRNPLWHGTPREKADAAYQEERNRPAEKRWDGLQDGEPVRDFVVRIHSGANSFLLERGITRSAQQLPVWNIEKPERSILLIAHAGTNSVFINHMLGLTPTPWEWERFVIAHASINRLSSYEIGDGHTFGLTKLSDVEHLHADERTY